MAYSGKFFPRNVEKYRGEVDKIRYRSLWERTFMERCDANPNVLQWNSEGLIIPYISPLDGKTHRYFVDFWTRTKMPDGTIKDLFIEIKPNHERTPPKRGRKKPARYLEECKTYAVNQAKWKRAKEVAEMNDSIFIVMDEYDLGLADRTPKRKPKKRGRKAK